jgi:hypothetical protein
MNSRHRRSFRCLPASTLAALALLSPAGAPAGPLHATSSGHAGRYRYPNAIVVIGDSGATGVGSDPAHPFRDQPQYSWATGTNPAVDSVYARILAADPAVQAHATNLAQDNPSAAQFGAQVRKAATLSPRPELVIVQVGDRPLAACDGNDAAHYAAFGERWRAALASVATALPTARIFVLSTWGGSYGTPWGSIDSNAKYLDRLEQGARLAHAGKHLCQLVDSASGRVVPERVAYVKHTLAGYEAQKAAACARIPQCRYDHGAAMRLAVTADDVAPGGTNMTIAGNAQLAAAEWKAMVGFVDRFPTG